MVHRFPFLPDFRVGFRFLLFFFLGGSLYGSPLLKKIHFGSTALSTGWPTMSPIRMNKSAPLSDSPQILLVGFAGNSDWNSPLNWQGGSVPSSGDVAVWGGISPPIMGINMLLNGGTQFLGALWTNATALGPMYLGNLPGNSGGRIYFHGATIQGIPHCVMVHSNNYPIHIQAHAMGGSGPLAIELLGLLENRFLIQGSGDIHLEVPVHGLGTPVHCSGNGTGALILAEKSYYTGLTTLSGGKLRLAYSGGETLPSGNSIRVLGGTLEINSSQTLMNLELLSGTLQIAPGVCLTILGQFSGGGNIDNQGELILLGNGALPSASQTISMNRLTLNHPLGFHLVAASTVDTLVLAEGVLQLNGNPLSVSGHFILGNGSIHAFQPGDEIFVHSTFDLTLPPGIFHGTPSKLTLQSIGELYLSESLSVDTIQLLSGNLQTGEYTLSPNVILGGHSGSYIKTMGSGGLEMTCMFSPVWYPVGRTAFNPVEITNLHADTVNYTVRVMDEVYQNGYGGPVVAESPRVYRSWQIEKTNSQNTGFGNLHFFWNSNEYSPDLQLPTLYHFNQGMWQALPGSATFSSGTLYYPGYIGVFSLFAIGDIEYPLPLDLIQFYSECDSQDVLVTFELESLKENAMLKLEYSSDLITWNILEEIDLKNHPVEPFRHTYRHNKNPIHTPLFFKLSWFETSGNILSYPIIQSLCQPIHDKHWRSSFNSELQSISLWIFAKEEGAFPYEIYSVSGVLMQKGVVHYSANHSTYLIPFLHPFSEGLYFFLSNWGGPTRVELFPLTY